MRLRIVLYIAQVASRCAGLVVSQADERLVLPHDGLQTAQHLQHIHTNIFYLCMCVHVCMYVCMHVLLKYNSWKQLNTCKYVCIYACIIYVCMNVCICMYVVCMYACIIYVCMYYLCMYECMYVCLNVWIYIYVCKNALNGHTKVCM